MRQRHSGRGAKATAAHGGITFDAKWEEHQRKWWLHKTWIDELYERRSDYAHDGATSASAGWTPFQHLLMTAFVFPLVVKKMLAGEGAYTLTDEDDARCRAINKLLLASAWNGNDENTSWTSILRAERKRLSDSRIDAIVTELLAQHTDD